MRGTFANMGKPMGGQMGGQGGSPFAGLAQPVEHRLPDTGEGDFDTNVPSPQDAELARFLQNAKAAYQHGLKTGDMQMIQKAMGAIEKINAAKAGLRSGPHNPVRPMGPDAGFQWAPGMEQFTQ